MGKRPERVAIINELGRTATLAEGPEQFVRTGSGESYIFLGLGPRPEQFREFFPEIRQARWVEAPDFLRQMDERGPAWRQAIPDEFIQLEPTELTPDLIRGSVIHRYIQGPRLFPGFWNPLWARCDLALEHGPHQPDQSMIWLGQEEDGLLVRELALAFEGRGRRTRLVTLDRKDAQASLLQKLAEQRPALFLSINFKGLDSHGRIFHLLREAGCKVAVWFVDNPFHVLTSAKADFWKEAVLLVTDAGFMASLRKLGATSVHHLPLAASPALFARPQGAPPPAVSGLEDKLVFVGRTAFPHKQAFFAGTDLDQEAWGEARAMLGLGERPDFFWWARRLGIEEFWPGNAVRRAGLGAEESGREWRTLCLDAALKGVGDRLAVFGDQGWQELLPGADLRPSVDYYTALPHIYAAAGASLNMTSPLLPAGLTQRHFDVWCGGGLLLTDDTPGLEIFPAELVEAVRFRRPADIPGLFAGLSRDHSARERLIKAWQEHILAEHTYARRVDRVLDLLEL